ncbi:platelet glycoprotein V [Nothobranchius furzeri]|uniref:Glycoprotein V (Platelet) n=1 Tax=Nothobranchius furzeri TaxID=105023 RepID=A0A1A8A9L3_NOTFU|nr:platelet glycoprotein V-like [Nothobranchius furzeri]
MDSCHTGLMWVTLILVGLSAADSSVSCPANCQCSSEGYANCTGVSITDIPPKLPLHTYTLNLFRTNMSVLSERSLAEQVFLVRFSLTNGHLHTIHPRAFNVAPQLKTVKLSSNVLSSLPDGVFSPLTSLEEIYLDGNQLTMIAPDTFKGLRSLLILDLNNNKLSNLSFNIFDGLTNLSFLNLGRNQIKTLPPTIFHSLTKLRLLAMYANKLEQLEAGIFDRLVILEELTLFQNQIASLPPKVFWPLKNLRTLSMSSNRLQNIPPKSFYNMSKLVKLTIYKNPLLSLPDELMGYMPDIREFYLYGTELVTVPGNLFSNMSGLLHLNLHLNPKLSQLPSDLFCCLPKLQKLSLRNNQLQYLHPQLFFALTSLSILLLNDNNLVTLPESIFKNLGGLETLDLKGNHLKTLPEDLFSSNTALNALHLGGNPWNCSCIIRGFARWVRQNAHVVPDKVDTLCHSPFYQALRRLDSLLEEEFDYCDRTAVTSVPTQANVKEQTQPLTVRSTTPTAQSTTSETTTNPPVVQTTSNTQTNEAHRVSPYFNDTLVLQQGPEYVHHNHHNGWVYVWFLPSSSTLVGFLMVCYILLLATGLLLILAAIFGLHRLSTTMDKLKANCNAE